MAPTSARAYLRLLISLAPDESHLEGTFKGLFKGIVNSLGGATLGSLIELIYPGIMILWTYKASQRKDTMVTEAFSKFEGILGLER